MIKPNYQSFCELVKKRNQKINDKHLKHKKQYKVRYGDYDLTIDPQVFNPAYGEGSLLMLKCKSYLHGRNVLDIGTGSGALAILAAEKSTNIVATDISPIAIKCARKNIKTLGLEHKIELREGNLFNPIKKNEKFDLIIFNPPFLEGQPESLFEKSIFHNNFETLEKFFSQVNKHLTKTGIILFCYGVVGNLSYLEWLISISGYKYKKIKYDLFSDMLFFIYEIKRGG